MEERRRCTTVRQLEVLYEFLEGNRDLALGRVRSKEARAVSARLWGECAEMLNSLGPARTSKEWAKVWNDQKCRVRAKLVAINASHQATGGGPSNAPILTPLEEKVANIIGRDVGPLPNVRQDQFAGCACAMQLQTDDLSMVVEEVVVDEIIEQQPATREVQNFSPSVVVNITHEEPPPPQFSPEPNLRQVPSPQPTQPYSKPRTADRVRRARERRRTERVTPMAQAQIPHAPSARSALEESRSMVLKIEEMRAQTALLHAQSMAKFAESFKLIAESIDRMSRRYCSSQNHQQDTGL